MKMIFIPVSDRPECAAALHHGFTLAQQLDASIEGCHFRPHTDSTVSLPDDDEDSLLIPDSYDMAWDAALKENEANDGPVKAKNLFAKMAEQYQYHLTKKTQDHAAALWSEKVGSPDRLFAIAGPVTDLIVVSRPAKPGKSMAKTIMMNAVLNASSPVLVLPQNDVSAVGKRICIAWDQSAEAALAVKAALPLLQQAEHVSVVTSGYPDKLGPKPSHLAKYLSAWGIDVECQVVKKGSDVDAITYGFEQAHADLLVMGGYSHSRLRQRIFGGVTEYMLTQADMPVLLLNT